MDDESQDLSRYRFPHLDDTPFPLLENVDVYEYRNDFDYERWTDNTKIHLCNVLWNSDYSNVVKFENDQTRDSYFDNIDGYSVELTSAFNMAPNGEVKVPIPYQVATRYNYMYVDLPIMTSEEQPINYENTRRTQRFYYFILGLQQNSPNSTTLIVKPDSWTTYINNIDIPYMMLERGHAPMAAVDAGDYLANPIANNTYLLAPDFDFGNGSDVVKSADFVPMNNGAKYILFATTMSLAQVKAQKYPPAISTANTPATFEDYDSRYGYQFTVNDYEWGIGGYNYNGLYTETDNYQSASGSIPNNMCMIAVAATNAHAMFAYMANTIPFFYKTIKACFMVDDTMFTKGTAFTFCEVQVFPVLPAADSVQTVLANIKLEKSDFGYDAKYADIAKLYTSPYSRIEVTDNNGVTKAFKIENTSNLAVRKATSIAFPYVSIQAYITGVNGSGYTTYSWQNLNGNSTTRAMFTDDFGEYLWQWDIPTYALFARGYDEYKASNYPKQFTDRYNAIVDYHNEADTANTQRENAVDGADNTQTMTNNSATAENTNALNMNDTINKNNINSSNTGKTNADESSNTAYNNVTSNSYGQTYTMGLNRELEVFRMGSVTTNNINMAANAKEYANDLNTQNMLYDNQTAHAVTDAENTVTQANGVQNAVSSITGGASGAASALGNLNPIGAIGSLGAGVIDAVFAGISTHVTVSANEAITNATNVNNINKTAVLNTNNSDLMTNSAIYTHNNLTSNQQAYEGTINNTRAMMNANAKRTNDTNLANDTRTNNTEVANANRTKSTSDGNANRTKSNTVANAKLNRDLTANNASYTRASGIRVAKRNLERKRINNQATYYGARLNAPVQYGTYSGDPSLDAFERRGLQVKVRTQADGDIAQAGDLMLRFGYALNQVWDVGDSGLLVMKHYTYWKAADLWINEGEGVNQDALADIQQAFEDGVTVWKDPDKIGKVSIYDNWQ